MSKARAAAARTTPGPAAGEAALAYALFSRLTASPHDWDDRSVGECRELIATILRCVPAPDGIGALGGALDAAVGVGSGSLADRYASLFEVGTPEPPLPIREELTATAAPGSKEEVVRFYDLFGYEVRPRYAWAPDHLALLLEFLAWLAGGESAAAPDDAVSYALAQRDFLERHVGHWLPALAAELRRRDATGFHARVFDALEQFVGAERRRLGRDAGA